MIRNRLGVAVLACAALSSIAREGGAQVVETWSVPMGAGWPSTWDVSGVGATMTIWTGNSAFNPDMPASLGTNPRGIFSGSTYPSYMVVLANGATDWSSYQKVDGAITHQAIQIGLVARYVQSGTWYGCLVSGGDNLQIYKEVNGTYTTIRQASPVQKITHLAAAGDPVSPWYTMQFQVIQVGGQTSLSCGLWQRGAPPAQMTFSVFVTDATSVLNTPAPSKSGLAARSGSAGTWGYYDNYYATPMGC
jgi:hypothetical protein